MKSVFEHLDQYSTEGTAREWYETIGKKQMGMYLPQVFRDRNVTSWPNNYASRLAIQSLVMGYCIDKNGNVGHKDITIHVSAGDVFSEDLTRITPIYIDFVDIHTEEVIDTLEFK